MADFHSTDVEVPATLTVDGQTLPGRRRPLPGHVVVLERPRGPQAVAERLARLRRPGPEARRLQDAEPAELARGPDASCTRSSIPRSPGTTSRRRRPTSSGSSSTARAGASTSTPSSSTRSSSPRTSRTGKGARWKVRGNPGGRRRAAVPRRRRRGVQAAVRDQVGRQRRRTGRPSIELCRTLERDAARASWRRR